MIARISHLLINARMLRRTGEIAECFVFDWKIIAPKNWEDDNSRVREALKREIPRDDWEWNDEEKRWYVKVEHREAMAAIFERFDDDVAGLEKSLTLF